MEGKDSASSPPWPLPSMFPHYHPPSPRVTTWGLVLIGDNAADKMRLCGPQVGHQLVEVLLEVGRGEKAHRAGRQNWKPQISPLRAGRGRPFHMPPHICHPSL